MFENSQHAHDLLEKMTNDAVKYAIANTSLLTNGAIRDRMGKFINQHLKVAADDDRLSVMNTDPMVLVAPGYVCVAVNFLYLLRGGTSETHEITLTLLT